MKSRNRYSTGMPSTKSERAALPLDDEDAVEVRVSTKMPRARPTASSVSRAQGLATGLLEAIIGQLAEYIETSPAVEKLIRAQTTKVLRELARDPELSALFRAQMDEYLAELASNPQILEPIVRAQVDRYLAKGSHRAPEPKHKKKVRKKEISVG
jgi:hypothetical protein